MSNTNIQFDDALQSARKVFLAKHRDYGSSWRIMRPVTLTDQILIKARRIRNIEEGLEPLVKEDTMDEFMGILNYSLMALIQLDKGAQIEADLDEAQSLEAYDGRAKACRDLMTRKNHDYGEAWRSMRVSSFTDIILTKLSRIKEIEGHSGQTSVSEGAASNYMDIAIYAVFAIIKLTEERQARHAE